MKISAYLSPFLSMLFLAAGVASKPAFEVVQEVGRERIEAARQAGLEALASELEIDLAAGISSELGPSTGGGQVGNLSVLRDPYVKEGNPLIAQLVQGAQRELRSPDFSWFIPTQENPLFLGGGSPRGHLNPRDTAGRMDALLWLYANPASPLKGDPEVLRRFLRRAHVYTDAMLLPAAEQGGQQIYDDFAMAPASVALREFAALYPELLLPSQRRRWDAAMRQAGDAIMRHTKNHRERNNKGYANIDVTKAFQLLNFGLYLQDAEMIAAARQLIAAQERAILPDGGTHYIWSQNESCGYHEVIPHYLARFHEVSGDTRPLEFIKRLQWYGPVSCGPLAEYWTAPSWKHTWNSNLRGLGGGHFVASVSENPWVVGMLLSPAGTSADPRNWFSVRAVLPWYRQDLSARALPDQVTYPDRNIAGVRAWYGRFSYAATLRDLPVDEPGHATLVGAHFMEAEQSLGAILMGAFPRVRVGANPDDLRSWAWLTSGMQSALVLGRNFSALAASYELAVFGSSRKGALSGWRGRQIWLGMPDRLVGWLDVSRGKRGSASAEAEIVLRVGTGGTINGPERSLEAIGPAEWKYGGAIVRLVADGMGRVETAVVPFRLPQFPVSEIMVRANPGDGGWALAEIRTEHSLPATEIKPLGQAGLEGFSVAFDDRQFLVAANFSDQAAKLLIPDQQVRTSIWISGEEGAAAVGAECLVPPGGVAMVVQSSKEEDHLAGWSSYQQMVENLSTGTEP